jgi:hypothetical protein
VTIPLSPGSYNIEHFRPPEKVNGHPTPEPVARKLGSETALMLLRKELPEIKFIVPGYVTEGLTILAGKGKIGKSWLALGIAIAVASGGYALGSIKVEQGDVLYLALEDNERRLQRRLRQLFARESGLDRLYYDLACPPLDKGGIDAIGAWIRRVPAPRLVVIDVLAKVRPPARQIESAYEADYRALGPLKQLADDSGVAIMLVHHTRKAEAEDAFDAVSGSTGLTGAADATLVLSRAEAAGGGSRSSRPDPPRPPSPDPAQPSRPPAPA